MANSFSRYADFYLYYLSEHQDVTCRRLHYAGSFGVLGILLALTVTGQWQWLWTALLIGYGFAWIGHFKFEHNKPATFKYPFYSFISDWVMLKDWLTGQLEAKLAIAQQRHGQPELTTN
ncbi:DUF962 domain-containing protein [Ferrimonas lipolytica]|uniref:DUF962 domain-containing protein n=1 Tax=Ferrimonas lipolytica TaxID=2724191 RepID=A0A6H1UAI2_9GAMM|nr:DUF962 domain-containing protein [Ferrimonas lipolytica]QIZ76044.1 DUF962 domain-containing protein [Ferrimonas lipolytica]